MTSSVSLPSVGPLPRNAFRQAARATQSGAYDLKTIANLPGLSASYASLTGSSASASISTSVYSHHRCLTVEQATRTANSIYLQGNAGNDTIALGDEPSCFGLTFAGGQGNDYIIVATNVNDVWAGTGTSSTALPQFC